MLAPSVVTLQNQYFPANAERMSVHCLESGYIGKYTPRGPRDFPRAGILHPEGWNCPCMDQVATKQNWETIFLWKTTYIVKGTSKKNHSIYIQNRFSSLRLELFFGIFLLLSQIPKHFCMSWLLTKTLEPRKNINNNRFDVNMTESLQAFLQLTRKKHILGGAALFSNFYPQGWNFLQQQPPR